MPVTGGVPECQTLFDEVLAQHFTSPAHFGVHRLFVDAYCYNEAYLRVWDPMHLCPASDLPLSPPCGYGAAGCERRPTVVSNQPRTSAPIAAAAASQPAPSQTRSDHQRNTTLITLAATPRNRCTRASTGNESKRHFFRCA